MSVPANTDLREPPPSRPRVSFRDGDRGGGRDGRPSRWGPRDDGGGRGGYGGGGGRGGYGGGGGGGGYGGGGGNVRCPPPEADEETKNKFWSARRALREKLYMVSAHAAVVPPALESVPTGLCPLLPVLYQSARRCPSSWPCAIVPLTPPPGVSPGIFCSLQQPMDGIWGDSPSSEVEKEDLAELISKSKPPASSPAGLPALPLLSIFRARACKSTTPSSRFHRIVLSRRDLLQAHPHRTQGDPRRVAHRPPLPVCTEKTKTKSKEAAAASSSSSDDSSSGSESDSSDDGRRKKKSKSKRKRKRKSKSSSRKKNKKRSKASSSSGSDSSSSDSDGAPATEWAEAAPATAPDVLDDGVEIGPMMPAQAQDFTSNTQE